MEDATITEPCDIIEADARLKALAAVVGAKFSARFGRAATLFAAGPGRVNLIGEHVDYNDGFVLPMAIDRCVLIAADLATGRPPGDAAGANESRVCSLDRAETAAFSTRAPVIRGQPAWANYVRGVVAGFQQRGVTVPAFDAMIGADLPMGGGLSSSAALEVATATLLEAITTTRLFPVEKALLCQKAEHDFAGVPCGIMDQFASTMGRRDHLLLLDCRSQKVEPVAMRDEMVRVLIVNSNVKHELSGGEYAARRRQCEEAARALGVASLRDATMAMLSAGKGRLSEVVHQRARHVVSEIARTVEAAAAIRIGDWAAVGERMYESHASLRDDFEVSCAELDALVEIAKSVGEGTGDASLRGSVIGCRMTGGGFGGCVVCLVRSEVADRVAMAMTGKYRERTGIEPSWFTTRPAAGARLV